MKDITDRLLDRISEDLQDSPEMYHTVQQAEILEAVDLIRSLRRQRSAYPHLTPNGHVYMEPQTAGEMHDHALDWAQGDMENWDEPERVPEPTWKMIVHLLNRLESMVDERNQYRYATSVLYREMDDAGVKMRAITKSLHDTIQRARPYSSR